MNQKTTLKTVVTALFAALIRLATMLVQIPIPATGGYANLGDGVILICAFLMHPFCAAIAAGIGSALADVLAGYVAFVPGMVLGYFSYEAVLLGVGMGAAGSVIACAAAPVLRRSDAVRSLADGKGR